MKLLAWFRRPAEKPCTEEIIYLRRSLARTKRGKRYRWVQIGKPGHMNKDSYEYVVATIKEHL